MYVLFVVSFRILVRIRHFFCLYLLGSMHVLNFVFRICVIRFSNNVGTIMCLGIVILRSPKKGPVEILTRSSISSGFQTKANFKMTASR